MCKLVGRNADYRVFCACVSVFARVGEAFEGNAAAHFDIYMLARSVYHETVSGIGGIFVVWRVIIRISFLGGVVITCVEYYDAEFVGGDISVAVEIVFFKVDKFVARFYDIVNHFVRRACVIVSFEIAERCGVGKRQCYFDNAFGRAFFLRMIYMRGRKPESSAGHLFVEGFKRFFAVREEAFVIIFGF